MRKRFCAFVLLILLVLLAGCRVFYQAGTPKSTGYMEPYYIVSVNVPYADNTYAHQFDDVSLLEEDGYGRKLYSYRTYSTILHDYIDILVISQMSIEQEGVFYYQDRSYFLKLSTDADFTETEIAELKEINDWNMPLCQEKMTCFSPENSSDRVVYSDTFTKNLLDYLELDGETHVVLEQSLEKSSETRQLFFAMVLEKSGETLDIDDPLFYLVAYDTNSIAPIVCCKQATGSLDCQEEVRAFREALPW